ncbi:MAG: hypothetical protein E7166_00455 [Firmicutes bacterium]|nr:hypothetical protein [Bacillota bacterium]
MKYKVIEEYDRFYLTVHPKGYKENFPKYKYQPDENGYITVKSETNYFGGKALPSGKVNRSFIK